MQVNCYQCHEKVDGNLYCQFCGTEQRCLACATPYETDGKYCSECGVEKGKTRPEETEAKPVQEEGTESKQEISQTVKEARESPEAVVVNEAAHVQQTKQRQNQEEQTVNHQATKHNQKQQTEQVDEKRETKSRSQQATTSAGNKKRKWPLFIALAAIIAAAVAAYFIYFDQGAKTPEEAVESFVDAMEARDLEKMKSYILPAIADDLIEDIDYKEVPRDTEFQFLRMEDLTYTRDTMVEVEAEISINEDGDKEEVLVEFELLQVKNKWFIVDIY